jgi:hypothetical protein
MTGKKKILDLPFPSTGVQEDPVLSTNGADLLLLFVFDDYGEARPKQLRFTKQRAFRKLAESYCTVSLVTDTYDTVCEVEESGWVRELRAVAAPRLLDKWILRHFIIYVDSFGCLEVVAEAVVLEDGAVR